MFLKQSLYAGAAAVALFAFAPSAEALTIQFTNSSGTVAVSDGDAADTSGLAGTVSASFTDAVTGTSVSVTAAEQSEAGDESLLTLIVLGAEVGVDDFLDIDATAVGYSAASFDPAESLLSFSLNGALFGSVDPVDGQGFADSMNTAFGQGIAVGGGTAAPGDTIISQAEGVLADPFSLSIFTSLESGEVAQYDAALLASPVPVPAGAVLMGTAIAGFGIARRRRKS